MFLINLISIEKKTKINNLHRYEFVHVFGYREGKKEKGEINR